MRPLWPVECLLCDLAQPGLIPGNLLQVSSLNHSLSCFNQQRQAVKGLGDRVVKFPRQPVSLSGDGFFHLALAQCFLNLHALFDFLL